MKNTGIQTIINQLRNLQDGENWLGSNLKEKIETVDGAVVYIRPVSELHSVAELVSHMLVWRQSVLQKLQGTRPELKVHSPLDWRTNEELRKIGWETLKQDLYSTTGEFVDLLTGREDDFLDNTDMDGYTFRFLLDGIIQHDLYHLGQIAITAKLLKNPLKSS